MACILNKAISPLCCCGRNYLHSITKYRKLSSHASAGGQNISSLKTPTVMEPAEQGKKSVDVYTRLLKERIICLMEPVTDSLAADIVAQLLCLHFEDQEKVIRMYINSPGGSVTAGLAIYDTMQHIQNPVATLCVGQACSMGSLLLTAGTPGMRYASPHSLIMVHQPLAMGLQGYVTDLQISAARMKKSKEEIQKLYVKHTGLSPEEIEKALDRDNFLSPPEAKQMGLIDEVLKQ